MSKFKVGDRVRRTADAWHGMQVGDEATVSYVNDSGDVTLKEFGAERRIVRAARTLVLMPTSTTGVIRTVTRKEIVPGISMSPGRHRPEISVMGTGLACVDLRFGANSNTAQAFSAGSLREAAALFIELADALDGVAS